MQLIVAVTGASGAVYARRLLAATAPHCDRLHLIVSSRGSQVVREELGSGKGETAEELLLPAHAQVSVHDNTDLFSPLASGSTRWDGMVVVPCSMATLSRIAQGLSEDLISRAADVTLKERRRLVLVPRETPLNRNHLLNMLRVLEAGAVVLPAMPGFYQRPTTVEDLVDFVVQRICQAVGLRVQSLAGWREPGPGDTAR